MSPVLEATDPGTIRVAATCFFDARAGGTTVGVLVAVVSPVLEATDPGTIRVVATCFFVARAGNATLLCVLAAAVSLVLEPEGLANPRSTATAAAGPVVARVAGATLVGVVILKYDTARVRFCNLMLSRLFAKFRCWRIFSCNVRAASSALFSVWPTDISAVMAITLLLRLNFFWIAPPRADRSASG